MNVTPGLAVVHLPPGIGGVLSVHPDLDRGMVTLETESGVTMVSPLLSQRLRLAVLAGERDQADLLYPEFHRDG